jgi:hypothetical protein
MDEKVKEFCYKYDARARPSGECWRRPQWMPYLEWLALDPDAPIRDTIRYDDVPMVDITMPEDRFRALLEHDAWVEKAGLQDNQFFSNNVMRVSNIVVEHERECRIRQENPAVQKAWERYQMLLSTVKDYY